MAYNSSLKASTGTLATSIDTLTASIDSLTAFTASTETDTLLDFLAFLGPQSTFMASTTFSVSLKWYSHLSHHLCKQSQGLYCIFSGLSSITVSGF